MYLFPQLSPPNFLSSDNSSSTCLFSGHILDDEDLVQTLQQSKAMSEEVHKRVAKSEVTEKQLNQARQRYLPVSGNNPEARLYIKWTG